MCLPSLEGERERGIAGGVKEGKQREGSNRPLLCPNDLCTR